MNGFITISTAALLTTFLTGCASFKPEPRPLYAGEDQIGAVDSSMLIGTWQVTNLNPIENEPSMDVQITFNADGSTSGYSKMDGEDESNPLGKMEFKMTGNWSVNGDLVNQTVIEMEEVSGNPAAKFGAALALGLTKNKTAASNLYEASADHLVFFNEKEGLAQRFTRVD